MASLIPLRPVSFRAKARHSRLDLALLCAAFGWMVPAAPAGVLTSTRFEDGRFAERKEYALANGSTRDAGVRLDPVGTIDAYMGERSQALRFTWKEAPGAASMPRVVLPSFDLGAAPRAADTTTVSFDLWVAQLRPVRVILSSVDAQGRVQGRVERRAWPHARGAFQRYSFDLVSFAAIEGTFDPAAPQLQLAFEPLHAQQSGDGTAEGELRVDNVSFAVPTYFVATDGSNAAEGRSPKSAFKTLDHALARAQPGDVIMVTEGVYVSEDRVPLVVISRQGAPDRWITVRSVPGHSPILRGTGWNVLELDHDAAYIEIRDLIIEGFAQEISREEALADGQLQEKDGQPYMGDPRMNTNGISVDGRKGDVKDRKAHHIRIVGNTVRHMPGAGISAIHADQIAIHDNLSYHNCHHMRYASSGISMWQAWRFDADTGYKMTIVGNRSFLNRTFVPWAHLKKISDGNGIIIDDFINYQTFAGASNGEPYTGRTLVMNNLVFGNGGSGMHAYAANHVDFVHNTAYHNAQSPELYWKQISAGGRCRDVRLINNIMWAQQGKPLGYSLSHQSSEILHAHNLDYGDGDNAVKTTGGLGQTAQAAQAEQRDNRTGDPRFVRRGIDRDHPDFRVFPGSPAVGMASPDFVPLLDLNGNVRSLDKASVGALEPAVE